jgi:hypothetical protein
MPVSSSASCPRPSGASPVAADPEAEESNDYTPPLRQFRLVRLVLGDEVAPEAQGPQPLPLPAGRGGRQRRER